MFSIITASKLTQTLSLTFFQLFNLHLLNAFVYFLHFFRYVQKRVPVGGNGVQKRDGYVRHRPCRRHPTRRGWWTRTTRWCGLNGTTITVLTKIAPLRMAEILIITTFNTERNINLKVFGSIAVIVYQWFFHWVWWLANAHRWWNICFEYEHIMNWVGVILVCAWRAWLHWEDINK